MIALSQALEFRDAWAFWLLPLVVFGLWWRTGHRPAVAMPAAHPFVLPGHGLPTTWRTRLGALPILFEGASLLALLLALARPVQVVPVPPERPARDVLFCFDRSSSMAQEDLAPGRTRLAVGVELCREFVAARPADRFGFVAFARYADLGCPPTLDHAAYTALLDGVALVDAEGPEDATAIGAAVGMAADLLQRSDSPGKVLVVLTDGEENVATAGARDEIAPLHAAQWCKQRGVHVHTIALGRTNSQQAPLDTRVVEELAKVTGGRFFRADDAAALQRIYEAIDALEAAALPPPGVRVDEWFWPFVWLVFAFGASAAVVRRVVVEEAP